MSTGSQSGSQRLGKYELRERLGRGGMAEVWKAFDTQLERYVAIKLLHADLQADPEFITRFFREARAIASLHHPNIVQIHDFQTAQSPEANVPIAYMVMDYVEGQTLAHHIRNSSHAGKFPSSIDIVHLFTSISKAVDYAHQKGMIHRDIKPANILLDIRNTAFNPMGEPVLTDFGIAKLMDAASGTMSGQWLGTPLYISPEQAQGQPGTERSDIYSLGVILYEICSGVQPFRGENATAIRWQHIHAMPTPPALINPNIPPALAQVILRAMAKEPQDRFSSASTMTAAITEAFNLPVPADLILPAHLASSNFGGPTYPASSNQPTSRPYAMPPAVEAPQAVQTNPRLTASPGVGPGSPATPTNSTPIVFSSLPPAPNAYDAASDHASLSTQTPASSIPPATSPWRDWRRLLIAVVLILLLLLGSTIAALYAFSIKPKTTTVAAQSIVGSVIFLNSGQLNAQNGKGVDDQVQINLHNISAPASGKSYYAWLNNTPVGDEGTSVLLGVLKVNQGNAQLPAVYQDPQHANLLLNADSFLVTQEDSNITPTQPSTNRSTWIFYSAPPQVTLTHLRHLLAGSPELNLRQLDGGLGIWFLRNTAKLLEWASSARDNLNYTQPDTGLMHRQVIHILDYIDGEDSVSMDVPPNTPLLVSQHDAQVAIVGPSPQLEPPGSLYNGKGQVPPGYVYLIRVHLDAAVSAPQATAEQRQLANQIVSSLDQVRLDLEQARQDARQLATFNATQLVTPQARTLLNDMVTAIQSAYAGPIDPNLPQGGANGVYINLQRMASFDVQLYTAH